MCYVSCVMGSAKITEDSGVRSVTCIGSWVEKRSPNTRGGVRLITCFGLEIVSRSQ